MADTEEPDAREIEEARAFWQGTLVAPAIFSNHVVAMDLQGGVRVTFSETVHEGPALVRSAVMLSDFQAFQLWNMLEESAAVQRVRNFIADQQKNEPQT